MCVWGGAEGNRLYPFFSQASSYSPSFHPSFLPPPPTSSLFFLNSAFPVIMAVMPNCLIVLHGARIMEEGIVFWEKC